MKELVPSQHLADVDKAYRALSAVVRDTGIPASLYHSFQKVREELDEYRMQLGLEQSLNITSCNNQDLPEPLNPHIRFVQHMIERVRHNQSIVITKEKKEALQQEIEALEYVLTLAMRKP